MMTKPIRPIGEQGKTYQESKRSWLDNLTYADYLVFAMLVAMIPGVVLLGWLIYLIVRSF